MIHVPGIRAVIELLHNNPAQVKEVWIGKQKNLSRLEEIIDICNKENIPIYYKNSIDICRFLPDVNHQGVVAIISQFKYSSIEDLLKTKNRNSLIIALDHITDEGNLASIIRTSAFFGVYGIILPKRRSASVSAQVIKRSAGACFCLPIVRVTNMVSTLKNLRKEGFWIIGTSDKGRDSLYDFDWNRETVLVLGNEQKGISVATKKICHDIVSIPVFGRIDSLNVGVAAGIFISEIIGHRLASF